jgi:hypothetical protein
MTMKTTDLLELFAKAGQLDLSTFVKQDEDGNYVVKFYELYTNNFNEVIIIDKEGESDFYSGGHTFDDMMGIFDGMLREKEQEKIKAEKRKEVLAKLTDEERELLGVK